MGPVTHKYWLSAKPRHMPQSRTKPSSLSPIRECTLADKPASNKEWMKWRMNERSKNELNEKWRKWRMNEMSKNEWNEEWMKWATNVDCTIKYLNGHGAWQARQFSWLIMRPMQHYGIQCWFSVTSRLPQLITDCDVALTQATWVRIPAARIQGATQCFSPCSILSPLQVIHPTMAVRKT